MHPKFTRHRGDTGIIAYMEEMEGPKEEPKKDSIVEMIECMQNKDLAGCLRTLANHFEAEETEDTPV